MPVFSPGFILFCQYYALIGLSLVLAFFVVTRYRGNPVGQDGLLDVCGLFLCWPIFLGAVLLLGLFLGIEWLSDRLEGFWHKARRLTTAILFYDFGRHKRVVKAEASNDVLQQGGVRLSQKLLSKITKDAKPATSAIVELGTFVRGVDQIADDVAKTLSDNGFEMIADIFKDEVAGTRVIPEALKISAQYVQLNLADEES